MLIKLLLAAALTVFTVLFSGTYAQASDNLRLTPSYVLTMPAPIVAQRLKHERAAQELARENCERAAKRAHKVRTRR